MIELFRSWLLGIIATSLILAVIYSIAPPGKLRPATRLIGGLVLLMAVLGPLGRIDVDWDTSYSDYVNLIQDQIDSYRTENENRYAELISERVETYIADKGNEGGLVCHPSVTTRMEQGVPFPDSVVMDIPLDEDLAASIADDLGIPRERQIWRER